MITSKCAVAVSRRRDVVAGLVVAGAVAVLLASTPVWAASLFSGSIAVTIQPSNAVAAGAQWRVDGGVWRSSGSAASGLSLGSHTVSFKPLTGWAAPANQTLKVSLWQTTKSTGTYVLAQTGSLSATLTPPGAVAAGARWQVDGGAWQASGATVSALNVGSHTVTFNTVAGYTSPASHVVTVNANATTSITGTYVIQTGSVSVALQPAGAVAAGARWQVDGGAWQSSGATVSGLAVGAHTVDFNAVAGYTAPASQSVAISANTTTSVTGTYTLPTGSLSVTLLPTAAVAAGALWQVDGGAWQLSGATVSSLSVGSHTVAFNAVAGYATPASQTVAVSANTTAHATGTYTQTLSTSHFGRFTIYEGSKTCRTCHPQETLDVHGSLHYQWHGQAPYVTNITEGGKLGAINDFCTYPDISWISQLTNLQGNKVDGGCAQCHVGMGVKPLPEQTDAQLDNIDCLLCHSDSYKRKVAPVGTTLRFIPAEEKMTVSLLEAITDIKLPSRGACLNCHAYAGGGNNNKRGDLEEEHRNPTSASFDVHMAPTSVGGAGLVCTDCHVVQNHHIAGRGVDMRATDLDVPVACTNCHASAPHDSSRLNAHTKRVNCTVCHIPAFAKVRSTDMLRDYSQPAEIDVVKQLYDPHIDRQANVTPEYAFFDGTSTIYEFLTPAIPDASGYVTLASPLGSVTEAGSKIYAFKRHSAVQGRDVDTQALLPVKAGILFQTGDVDRAIRQGATDIGLPLAHGYDFVPTQRYMGLFHEVPPSSQALQCNACHNGGTRLDFDALGYTPKTTRNGRPLCASCHQDESGEWNASELFSKVHEKHVTDKKLDCIECHIFTK